MPNFKDATGKYIKCPRCGSTIRGLKRRPMTDTQFRVIEAAKNVKRWDAAQDEHKIGHFDQASRIAAHRELHDAVEALEREEAKDGE